MGDRWPRIRSLQLDFSVACEAFEVVALCRNAGADWGRLLRFPDPDGQIHTWSAPMEMCAGDGTELRGRLLEQGLTIEPNRFAKEE